ncbi:MAG: RNA-binding protein [Haloarculaceae archaeon]
MPSVPVHYVDLRAFCYATEDEKRVEQALRRFVPGPALPDEGADGDGDGTFVELDREVTEGFNGDRILILSVRLERADQIRYALAALAEAEEFDRLLAELDDRVDDNTAFFVTLDKQAAFRGDVRLGEGITFRAKVEAYPAKWETAVENARETLEGLREA